MKNHDYFYSRVGVIKSMNFSLEVSSVVFEEKRIKSLNGEKLNLEFICILVTTKYFGSIFLGCNSWDI